MRHEPPVVSCGDRRGVTLLELIVVLALMGLILALAAPSFIVPAPARTAGVTKALEVARHAALVRAEPLTLTIDDAGAWRIDGDASPSAQPIATGSLGARLGAVRVRVSALGACIPDAGARRVFPDWNVVDCRPASSPRETAR